MLNRIVMMSGFLVLRIIYTKELIEEMEKDGVPFVSAMFCSLLVVFWLVSVFFLFSGNYGKDLWICILGTIAIPIGVFVFRKKVRSQYTKEKENREKRIEEWGHISWICKTCGASNCEEDTNCKRCRKPRTVTQESDEIAQLEIIRPKIIKKENS